MSKSGFAFILIALALSACNAPDNNTDQTTQYRITGDASPLSEDWNNGRVVVKQRRYDQNGDSEEVVLNSIDTNDGKFELVGEIDRPTRVRIAVEIDGKQLNYADAILEAGAEISVRYYSRTEGLAADGTGTHHELISSWMFGQEYRDAVASYAEIMEVRIAEREAAAESESASNATQDIDDSNSRSAEDDAQDGSETATAESEAEPQLDEAYERFIAIRQIKQQALDELASSDDDPMRALLAMELGGIANPESAIERLDELAQVLPQATVDSMILPRRKKLLQYIEKVNVGRQLDAGVIAPAFSAPAADGESVALASILEKNKVVLLDFWASWCGPCIATFPDLKNLYANYNEKGFEIVSISIDDTNEDWLEALEEHDLPWINLGDISKSDGPVAMLYGVTGIPKTFLLEQSGTILDTDVHGDELHEKLKEKLL